MRQVALTLAAIFLMVATPVIAVPGDGNKVNPGDQCSNSATDALPCLRVDNPNPTSGVPSRVYFYAASAKCPPQVSVSSPFGDCGGSGGQSQAVVIPPVGILGLVYIESNGLDGLQRFHTSKPGDVMVLV